MLTNLLENGVIWLPVIGGVLVLGNRLQRIARHAAIDPMPDHDADRPHRQSDQVPGRLVGELQRPEVAALGGFRRVAQ